MWRKECHAINSRVCALLFTNATYNNYTPHTNTHILYAYRIAAINIYILGIRRLSIIILLISLILLNRDSSQTLPSSVHQHTVDRMQSCPWVGLTHGSIWVEILLILVGWVGSTIENVLKIWKKYVSTCKARLRKICLHQAVKFHLRLIWPVPETDQKGYTAYKNTSLLNCKLHC